VSTGFRSFTLSSTMVLAVNNDGDVGEEGRLEPLGDLIPVHVGHHHVSRMRSGPPNRRQIPMVRCWPRRFVPGARA
jgi:hypothetical protein